MSIHTFEYYFFVGGPSKSKKNYGRHWTNASFSVSIALWFLCYRNCVMNFYCRLELCLLGRTLGFETVNRIFQPVELDTYDFNTLPNYYKARMPSKRLCDALLRSINTEIKNKPAWQTQLWLWFLNVAVTHEIVKRFFDRYCKMVSLLLGSILLSSSPVIPVLVHRVKICFTRLYEHWVRSV